MIVSKNFDFLEFWKSKYSKVSRIGYSREHIATRKKRFLDNKVQKIEDYEELIYLLLFHDYHNVLFKKYNSELSRPIKEKWLAIKLNRNNNTKLTRRNIIQFKLMNFQERYNLLNFYDPNYIIISSLCLIDNQNKKFRLQGEDTLINVIKDFQLIPSYFQRKIILILLNKFNTCNKKLVVKLFRKNFNNIDEYHVRKLFQLLKKNNLMSQPYMIGFLHYLSTLNQNEATLLTESFNSTIYYDKIVRK